MPYSEYFNYNNCNHSYSRYGNYANATGETSHTNYGDHHSYHYNTTGLGCATYHSSYGDYHNAHYNYVNHQAGAHYNYSNHINYSNPNTGAPMTVNWSDPWSGNNLDALYISESIDAIKQLRDNLKQISTNKSQQNSSVDLESNSSRVGDQRFEAGNKIDDDQYDAIKESLDNLWSDIKGDDDQSTPQASAKNAGELWRKSDWEFLKQKIDELASYDDSADYSNTKSTTSGTSHTNHSSYFNWRNVPYKDI